jgi:hypothetical protein
VGGVSTPAGAELFCNSAAFVQRVATINRRFDSSWVRRRLAPTLSGLRVKGAIDAQPVGFSNVAAKDTSADLLWSSAVRPPLTTKSRGPRRQVHAAVPVTRHSSLFLRWEIRFPARSPGRRRIVFRIPNPLPRGEGVPIRSGQVRGRVAGRAPQGVTRPSSLVTVLYGASQSNA